MNPILQTLADPFTIIRKLDSMSLWGSLLIIIAFIFIWIAVSMLVAKLIHGTKVNPEKLKNAGISISIITSIYGLILAFLVVSMYRVNDEVDQSISEEISSLVAIIRASKTFDNRDQINAAVHHYIKNIVEKEWPHLVDGSYNSAWKEFPEIIDPLYNAIQRTKPVGAVQENFCHSLPGLLKNVVDAHRTRLILADAHLPLQLWLVICVTTLLLLWFLVYLNPWEGISSFIIIILPGIIIACVLSLLISFHYPFLGPLAISNEPYQNILTDGEID